MFFAALGLIELIFLGVFILMLAIGVSYDRSGKDEPKWVIFGLGLLFVAIWFWKDFTFSELWADVRSWHFWKPVLMYVGAGLLYSILEFALEVRRSAKFYAAEWKRHFTSTVRMNVLDEAGQPKTEEVLTRNGTTRSTVTREVPISELYAAALAGASSTKLLEAERDGIVKTHISRFLENGKYQHKHTIVSLKTKNTSWLEVEPVVNRGILADHIAAWTTLWPAYAVSLILGDLLQEVFTAVANFVASLSGRAVRAAFKNVFKF